jgi:hypothetical protein
MLQGGWGEAVRDLAGNMGAVSALKALGSQRAQAEEAA